MRQKCPQAELPAYVRGLECVAGMREPQAVNIAFFVYRELAAYAVVPHTVHEAADRPMVFRPFAVSRPPYRFLRPQPFRVFVFLHVFFLPADFVGDGKPHFAAHIFRRARRLVTDESRVIQTAVYPDAVRDQVYMQFPGIGMASRYSLVVIQPHAPGEPARYFIQVGL